MNSGRNIYKKNDNKENNKNRKEEKNNINKKIVNKEDNFLNKKKKRERNEEPILMNQNQNEKLEINQNMYNQYNFYQGIMSAISPIELIQLQQLNNQKINYQNMNNQEYLQNFYYMQNPYSFIPNGPEFRYYGQEEEETPFKDLKGHINSLYKRGISNNIIGAFFIEENKEKNKETNEDEETINNKIKKGEKGEKYQNLNYDKSCELEYNKGNLSNKKQNKIENENSRQEKEVYNDLDGNNSSNKNRLIKPVLIW